MAEIQSPKNRRIVEAVRLQRGRERRLLNQALIEGPHLLDEAVAAGVTVRQVFGLVDDERSHARAVTAGASWFACSRAALERLSTTETPRGPVAVIDIPADSPIERDAIWAHVKDPGNAGTLIRTAAAFGMDVVLDRGAVDVWSPKVMRAAAGAHFHTNLATGRHAMGPDVLVIATLVTGGTPLPALPDELDHDARYVVLVGSEPRGLSDDDLANAHHRVTIPMPGNTESLNAAVAGAVVAYELMRWRNSGSRGTGRH